MANDDNDDPQPSFKELQKRWAQQGTNTVKQEQQKQTVPLSGMVDSMTTSTTPSPKTVVTAMKPIASSSSEPTQNKQLPIKSPPLPVNNNLPVESPVNNSRAPPIPPKPSVVAPTSTTTPMRTPPPPTKSPSSSVMTNASSESICTTISNTTTSNDQRQRVSLLAQQFEKQKISQVISSAAVQQQSTANTTPTTTNATPNVSSNSTPNLSKATIAPAVSAIPAEKISTPSPPLATTAPAVAATNTSNTSTPPPPATAATKIVSNVTNLTQSPRSVRQRDISEQESSTSPSTHAQDPFCDDEEVTDSSDDSDDSSNETNNTSSDDSELDDRLVRQVHLRYAEGASSSGSLDSTITTPARTPPPPPKGANNNKKIGTPPPPPPPSKKYHTAARRATVAVDIPEHQQQQAQQPISIPGKPMETSPPILPPRPCLPGRGEGMPVLPPRPSQSTLARSHTIGSSFHQHHHQQFDHSVPLPDVEPPPLPHSGDYDRPRRSQSTRTTSARRAMSRSQMQMANEVHPDATNASRNKPIIESKNRMTPSLIPTGHKCMKNAVAISGGLLATGAHETQIWETSSGQQPLHTIGTNGQNNDGSDKVCALEFAPVMEPSEEGRYLWVGLKDSDLFVIDTTTGKICARPNSTHTQPINWILRYKNMEMWTIDEGGIMNVWEVLDGSIRLVDEHAVTPRASAALIVGRDLWMATTRAYEVHHLGGNLQQQDQHQQSPRIRIPNELGDIVQLAVVPYHVGKIFIGHGDGKVSVWDANTMERLEVITVSMYAISCMVAIGDYYLWMGFNTGMIYVYDTRPQRWLVVKLWKAHESGVSSFSVDKIGLALDEPTVQVVSMDSHGYAAFWDGLLSEQWKDQQMEKFRADYSEERVTRILICSWNIDANKPEKLPPPDDQLVREWLSSMRDPDPDIIVVGIQEIVDLESKKQTARSLFASRKKIETLQEADELLTHRYTLWHDHLVRVMADNYGRGAYTVIKTDQLVGLFSCIFVRSSELSRVSAVDSTIVKTGMKVMKKSLHGNKGGIAIRLQLDDSSLCFVNCHLAAGQSHQAQRNADAEGILKEAKFPTRHKDVDAYPRGGAGELILDHEHCFLSGDLNYRINMPREKVLQYLANRNPVEGLAALQKEDQLLKQRFTNPFFKLLIFQESAINFLPTYKYDPGTDYYDRSEKKRVPAWCDRILYRSNNVQNLFYQRHEVLASDHRPISGGFTLRVKKVDHSKKANVVHHVEEAWQQRYQELVKHHKEMYVADFGIQDPSQRLQAVGWDVHQIRY